jgi:FkbM family methyltransferase
MIEQLKYNCTDVVFAGGVDAVRKVRKYSVGDTMDGEWTMCASEGLFQSSGRGPCSVFSIGISNDWSFDETMAAEGCSVYSFDPSIDVRAHVRNKPFSWDMFESEPVSIPWWDSQQEDRPTPSASTPTPTPTSSPTTTSNLMDGPYAGKIDFKPIGLGAADSLITGEEMMSKEEQSWKVATLSSLMASSGITSLTVLKIDVEGHEWSSLETALDQGSLAKVQQLIFEVSEDPLYPALPPPRSIQNINSVHIYCRCISGMSAGPPTLALLL